MLVEQLQACTDGDVTVLVAAGYEWCWKLYDTLWQCQGKSEFIGRALARPVVKASSEKYNKPNFPPQLEWFDICRGSDRAGELLAAFELLQVYCYHPLAPSGSISHV